MAGWLAGCLAVKLTHGADVTMHVSGWTDGNKEDNHLNLCAQRFSLNHGIYKHWVRPPWQTLVSRRHLTDAKQTHRR